MRLFRGFSGKIFGGQQALKRAVLLLGCCLLPALSQAAGLVKLQPGLDYLRLTNLPADLPPSELRFPDSGTLVVDIRGAKSEAPGVAALLAWLDFRCKNTRATLLLVNEDSSASLREQLQGLHRPALLTLAPAGAPFVADMRVDVDSESDRKACAAIGAGEKLENLIQPKLDKERNDEARLTKEYSESPRTPAYRESEPETTAAETPAKPKPPLCDLVLARAVQLHTAAKTLKTP